MSKKKRKSKRKLKASRAAADTADQIRIQPAETGQPEAATANPDEYLPLERDLLLNVRTQWILGDWAGLVALERHRIEHHPDRAQLALYIAAGNSQLGQNQAARELATLAKAWGCNRQLMAQILISGTYNSLARTSALLGQAERFERHVTSAMATGMPSADCRLLAEARSTAQHHQLGLTRSTTTQILARPNPSRVPSFKVRRLASHALGEAWAGNTINTVIFRHHGILTHRGTQYTAFYVDTHTLRLVQRDLATNTLQTHDLPGDYNLRDAHNSISLGIDRKGHLHLSYGHHGTQLRYRRSLFAGDIREWSEELPMTGTHEEKVTYPTFILPRHEFPLTFLYRDGKYNKGSARLKIYDEATGVWTDFPEAILSGAEQRPWTSNAYWNHPALGTDGSLHLSFVWRTNALGEEQRINNINIDYACSHDNGLTWQTSKNWPYKLPITQVNSETIHPVSPGSNLINQTSMALDSHNRPHIAFYADDPDGIPQYQHLWFDGKVWRHQVVSQRRNAFSLEGGGTLQIPISRPEIVIDRDDHVYIITRGDHTQNRLAATFLPAPNYAYQENNIQTVSEANLGFAEPIIDRERWQQENLLTLLLQKNEQPNHDIGHELVQHPVSLIDIQINPTS